MSTTKVVSRETSEICAGCETKKVETAVLSLHPSMNQGNDCVGGCQNCGTARTVRLTSH